MVRDGIREELTKHRERLREPERLCREERAYGRLLAALGGEPLIPDPEMAAILGELAASIDAANEYGRVVAEHDALHALLAQVGRPDGAAA
jgi:hypothetical protein